MKKSSSGSGMNSYVSQQYRIPDAPKHLKKQFQKALPFPHLILNSFLQEKCAAFLLQALKNEPFHHKESDLFKFMQTNDLAGTQEQTLQKFRSFLMSNEFVGWMSAVTGIKLKSGVVDLAGSLYQDTDYLLCHDDLLERRKIAFMLYLSDLKEGEGGSLNLLSSKKNVPMGVIKKIHPSFNTFTFFEVSPHAFHEVEEVVGKTQRYTLGGWFHG